MNVIAQRLCDACDKIVAKDIKPYINLRAWLCNLNTRTQFMDLFKKYYGLNAGGLTDEWKKRYFDHLFSITTITTHDPYSTILNDLYSFPRLKGDKILAFSFVSKLVAIHDESWPLFDKHVSAFFGINPPHTGTNNFRIIGFLRNMRLIQNVYADWATDPEYVDILNNFRTRHPEVATCHNHRLFDFMVWATGHYKIG